MKPTVAQVTSLDSFPLQEEYGVDERRGAVDGPPSAEEIAFDAAAS